MEEASVGMTAAVTSDRDCNSDCDYTLVDPTLGAAVDDALPAAYQGREVPSAASGTPVEDPESDSPVGRRCTDSSRGSGAVTLHHGFG